MFLFLFVSACSRETATPTAAPVATQETVSTESPVSTEASTSTEAPAATEAAATSDSGMPVAGAGQCANAYYPVREGATWTYASTGSPSGNYSFTDTITAVRDDGFTLTSQFDQLTRTQEWSCKPEGLVALQLGGPSAATLSSQNMQLNLDVQNVTGVSYPSSINPGDTWQHNLEFTGKMSVANQEGEATGNAESNFTAVGMESVTVPAGTFDAMKIETNSTLNFNVNVQGISVPVSFSGTYTYWFAQGVGWVKATGSGDIGGQSFRETIELQSYNIP